MGRTGRSSGAESGGVPATDALATARTFTDEFGDDPAFDAVAASWTDRRWNGRKLAQHWASPDSVRWRFGMRESKD